MIIFAYTFGVIFVAVLAILGLGALISGRGKADPYIEGEATASMCTTQLLERPDYTGDEDVDDFVVEQDLVYTYDSFNL